MPRQATPTVGGCEGMVVGSPEGDLVGSWEGC